MRLAFVHGINNEKNTPESIAQDWWNILSAGWSTLGLPVPAKPVIDVGYYGKLLAGALEGRSPQAVAQGADAQSQNDARGFLAAYMEAGAISNAELEAALAEQGTPMPEVVQQGLIGRGLVASASAIERILLGRGLRLASGFLPQATQYIEDRGLARQIAVNVRKDIFDDKPDPVIVVSHSLGTVVAYDLLASNRLADRDVPLFVTLGSPLGIGMMQTILPNRADIPNPPIGRWTNAYRKEDPVTLGRGITEDSMGLSGVENISDGLVSRMNPHSIEAYLQSPPVCGRIYAALTDT